MSSPVTSSFPPPILLPRNQSTARRVMQAHFPFKCCAVCGLQIATCLTVAHLDHNAGNNHPDNLARLCQTHHWMYDSGLYPKEAISLLQAHWQTAKGVPDHKPRLKDAGAKAALTRKRRAAARKASETRHANLAKSANPMLRRLGEAELLRADFCSLIGSHSIRVETSGPVPSNRLTTSLCLRLCQKN